MSALSELDTMFVEVGKKAVAALKRDLVGQIGKWCEEHPGEQPTEEVCNSLFGLKAVGGKGRGRPKGSSEGKAEKAIEERCSAAKFAFSQGKYENARCKKGDCERDDGRGNLLCDKCGTAWDQVSKVMCCGGISYGSGTGAARSASGAAWAGIWKEDWADSDVPPVFEGQRCGGVDKDGKWSVNKSFALLKKESKDASWHVAGETWAIEGSEAAAPAEAELEEDTSPPADEGGEELVKHDGLSYAKAEHEGDTLFYARFGEDQPPSTDPEVYSASEEDGVWEWATGEAQDAHTEAMA